jgi:hypothetical protein
MTPATALTERATRVDGVSSRSRRRASSSPAWAQSGCVRSGRR